MLMRQVVYLATPLKPAVITGDFNAPFTVKCRCRSCLSIGPVIIRCLISNEATAILGRESKTAQMVLFSLDRQHGPLPPTSFMLANVKLA